MATQVITIARGNSNTPAGALSFGIEEEYFLVHRDASEINRAVDVLTNGTSADRKISICEDMRRSGCRDAALKARGRLARIAQKMKTG
ncbi:MAG: hypothetical protein HC869_02720 [Rhodospirillales bacterium]|nr:hypothetical protein [Rhodospirillales bacterium]